MEHVQHGPVHRGFRRLHSSRVQVSQNLIDLTICKYKQRNAYKLIKLAGSEIHALFIIMDGWLLYLTDAIHVHFWHHDKHNKFIATRRQLNWMACSSVNYTIVSPLLKISINY